MCSTLFPWLSCAKKPLFSFNAGVKNVNASVVVNWFIKGAGGVGINRSNTRAGGTSLFRDFAVYNGKQTKVLVVDGSAGEVGIGTDDPTGAFEINWNGTSTDMIMLSRPSTGGNFARLGHNTAGGANMLDVRSEGHIRFLTGGNNERLRIDSSGKLLINSSTVTASYGGNLQLTNSNFAMNSFAANQHAQTFLFAKSRGTSGSGGTIVQDNDFCGHIEWYADDGVDTANQIAKISAAIDGTPGANDTPGELLFYTTADGANAATERLRIQSNGTKLISNGHLNITSTYIDFSGSISTPATAAAIYRPADNTLAFSTANAERLRILNGGNISIADGNLVVASGHGIDFSATGAGNNGSDTSELLDDYEEGTWTPGVGGSSGSVTSYYNQEGGYTKIGRLVKCHFRIRVNDAGNAAGNMEITNLPYTVADTLPSTGLDGSGGPTYWAGQSTAIVNMTMTPQGGGTKAWIYIATGATTTMSNLTNSNAFGGGWDVRAELMYFTD